MADTNIRAIISAEDKASSVLAGFSASLAKTEAASRQLVGGLALAGAAIVGLGTFGLSIAGNLESARQGFVTLLGSTKLADDAIAQITKDAAATPFELPGLINANEQLTTVTHSASESEGFLLNVGKALAAMGKGQPELDRIIQNLQQIGSTGKISELDIRQFGFAGVDVLSLLADYYDTTKAAAADMLKNSKDAFKDLEGAFAKAGNAGGKFAEAFVNQAGTFNQLWSNVKDSFGIAMSDIVVKTGLFNTVKAIFAGIIGYLTDHKDDIVNFIKNTANIIQQNAPIIAGALMLMLAPIIISMGELLLTLAPLALLGAALGFAFKMMTDNGLNPTKMALDGLNAAVRIGKQVWDFLRPSLKDLWDIVQFSLFPALKQLWKEVLEPLAPVIGEILVGALLVFIKVLGTVIYYISQIISVGSSMFHFFTDTIPNALGNAGAAIINSIGNAYKYVTGLNWSQVVINIGKGLGNAIIDMINGAIKGAFSVVPLLKDHVPQIPHFASGVQNFSGGMALVGERGPELVNLPRGSNVIPNNQIGGMGAGSSTTVNITLSGVFTGTPSDARKLAQMVADSLKDIAGTKNMSASQLLGG